MNAHVVDHLSAVQKNQFITTHYATMRKQFLSAAQRVGANLQDYVHPLSGPGGEVLATDIARIGRADASRLLVIISGTHGAEAAYGSACQSQWLNRLDHRQLPDDVAILAIHCINPWGAAWTRRVTENNVDLNRNFIDWSKPAPVNEKYRLLHHAAAYAAWDGPQRQAADQALAEIAKSLGSSKALNAIIEGGQYEFADGLFYGGAGPEWSNRTLHEIMATHAGLAKDIILFDLHTGAGPYAYPALLSVAEREHAGIGWGRDIFGPALAVVLTGNDATTDTGIAATATGYISAAVVKMLPKARLLPLVIECGTLDAEVVGNAVREDNWLCLHGDLDSPLAGAIKQRLRTGFIPEDKSWEEACIPASLRHFDRALASLRSLGATAAKPLSAVAASSAADVKPAVEIHDLHKSFGNLEVLKGVSLTAQPGEVVSMIGSSGSGKSTFLRCINLLEQPEAGRIIIDGEEIGIRQLKNGKFAPADLRQVERIRSRVGMVFQNFNLWPHMTVLENIIESPLHVLKERRADAIDHAHQLLKKVGLSEKHGYYPSQLSGGQQQRAAIARTLAMRPKVILLDEPTSALDPELVGEVLTVIGQLASEGNTMILVTHEMSFAREVSHKVMFLHQGRVEEEGAAAALFSNPQSPRLRQFLARTFNN